jgi:hypothetical protein
MTGERRILNSVHREEISLRGIIRLIFTSMVTSLGLR